MALVQNDLPLLGFCSHLYNMTLATGSMLPEPPLSSLKPAADAGDGSVLMLMGECHSSGIGVAEDSRKALKFFTRAFGAGHIEAAFRVAVLHDAKGESEQAFRWVHRAALLGNPEAMNQCAVVLWHGRGAPQDVDTAVAWFHKAALADHPKAMLNYANICFAGVGVVRKDSEQALYWYDRAIAAGCEEAEVRLADLYLQGGIVPFDPDKVRGLLARSAEAGDADSIYKIACCYTDFPGHENPAEATEWLTRAAFLDHKKASWRLGLCCLSGWGTRRDLCMGAALVWASFGTSESAGEAAHAAP